MAVAEPALPALRERSVAVPRGHLAALFIAFALSWFLGASAFFWPIVAFVLLLGMLVRGSVAVPGQLGLWLVVVAWVPLSALQLEEAKDGLVFAHRYLNLLAATVVFLWVFNSSRKRLPDSAIVNALTLYWAILVVGGYVGVLLAGVSYHSPFEQLLPEGLRANAFLHGSVHVQFADVQAFLGYPVGRPMVFSTATNAWGAIVALLTPFAFAAIRQSSSAARRRLLQALLVLSVVPIVISLNRGLWLALILAAAYVAMRFALRFDLRALAWFIAAAGVSAALLVTTPLGGLISQRLEHGHSNENRELLYREAFEGVKQSPLLGFGAPRPSKAQPKGPPVGTHSEIFFLSYSYGIPALIFFLAWFAATFLRAARGSGPLFWAHVTLLIFFIESPYYLLEAHLVILMIVCALVWRRRAPDTTAALGERREALPHPRPIAS